MVGAYLSAFTCSAETVALTLLVPFMTAPTPHHCVSIDLPKVNCPMAMGRAELEDALVVAIIRSGERVLRQRQAPRGLAQWHPARAPALDP
jgi:hypothetical protein